MKPCWCIPLNLHIYRQQVLTSCFFFKSVVFHIHLFYVNFVWPKNKRLITFDGFNLIMTCSIIIIFGFSIYVLSLQKCRIHQIILFWIGINRNTSNWQGFDNPYDDGLYYYSSHCINPISQTVWGDRAPNAAVLMYILNFVSSIFKWFGDDIKN